MVKNLRKKKRVVSLCCNRPWGEVSTNGRFGYSHMCMKRGGGDVYVCAFECSTHSFLLLTYTKKKKVTYSVSSMSAFFVN